METTALRTRPVSHRPSTSKPHWIFDEIKCWRCRKQFTVYENVKRPTMVSYECPRCGTLNI